MTTKAYKAIEFTCEYCEKRQYAEYTLDHEWFEDRYVNSDWINCEECGKENHVIQELGE